MARIRSIHPGLFTDEAFMSASPYARLMIIGIWGEAWDDGVFEWKPLTLKAKLFPIDVVDASSLLDELERLEFLKRFSVGGKLFGAIRNFCKWQRPKKPNSSRMLPAELRTYVALTYDSSEPVPNHSPIASEKSPQREDEGGRMEDEGGKAAVAAFAPAAAPEKISKEEIERRCEQAAGFGEMSHIGKIAALVEAGADLDGRVLPIIREMSRKKRERGEKPENWLYFVAAIADPDRKSPPPLAPPAEVAATVFVPHGSPAWQAWDDYGRRTKGSGYPSSVIVRGEPGWRFPTEWPSKDSEVAA
jgi:hypothetical protein